jgi:hypothetical protein
MVVDMEKLLANRGCRLLGLAFAEVEGRDALGSSGG